MQDAARLVKLVIATDRTGREPTMTFDPIHDKNTTRQQWDSAAGIGGQTLADVEEA